MENTKTIRMRATAQKAREYGYTPRASLVMMPVELQLDRLSPPARWIAEHITSTYVIDECIDICDIIAESTQTAQERDMKNGMDPELVRKYANALGNIYTADKLRIRITFPILCNNPSKPEDVLETTVRELMDSGAGRLYCGDDSFDLCNFSANKCAE